MIPSNELRITNYILRMGKVETLKAIYSYSVATNGTEIALLLDIDPIPLTQNILRLMHWTAASATSLVGFIDNPKRVWVSNYIGYGMRLIEDEDGNLLWFFWERTQPIKVEFFHTLQNIYFTIMGREMEVDEESLIQIELLNASH